MIILWILAITWNLCFGNAFISSFSNPEIKTGGLVMLGVFSTLGVVPIYFAIRETIRHFRYGMSVCMIDGKAGVLGKELTGKVVTKSDIEATGDYTFELHCLETYVTGTGKNKTSSTSICWQGRGVVPRAAQRSSIGIAFRFPLPPSPPETGCQLARGKVSWQLKVSAPCDGVDYAATFVIPVFKMA